MVNNTLLHSELAPTTHLTGLVSYVPNVFTYKLCAPSTNRFHVVEREVDRSRESRPRSRARGGEEEAKGGEAGLRLMVASSHDMNMTHIVTRYGSKVNSGPTIVDMHGK